MRAFKPLSFLQYHRKAEDAASALPGLMAIAEKAATSVLSGDHAQRKTGMSEKFWQFRDYDMTDKPQDIDWRQSAKGDRIYIKEKESHTAQTALFWCQHNESMTYRSRNNLQTKQECAIILALALGLLLTRGGEQIAPLSGSFMPGRSALALQKLGEQIIETHTEDLPEKKLRKIQKHSSLVLLGDFLTPKENLKEHLDLLAHQAQSALIIQVLDPAELTLPFEGRVIFDRTENKTNNEQHHINNVETVREAYQERLQDHMAYIKEYCRKHQWYWILHTTEKEISDTLFAAWMMMAPHSFHKGEAR